MVSLAIKPCHTGRSIATHKMIVSDLVKGICPEICSMHAQAGLQGVGWQGGGKVWWGGGPQLADDPNPAGAERPYQTAPGIHFIPATP